MKFNNRNNIKYLLYSLTFVLLVNISFLLFFYHEYLLYVIVVISVLLLRRFFMIKVFAMEITDDFISIKYFHPFSRSFKPTLEAPIEKIASYKIIRKEILNQHLILNLYASKGRVKSFRFNLGILSKKQNVELMKLFNKL